MHKAPITFHLSPSTRPATWLLKFMLWPSTANLDPHAQQDDPDAPNPTLFAAFELDHVELKKLHELVSHEMQALTNED